MKIVVIYDDDSIGVYEGSQEVYNDVVSARLSEFDDGWMPYLSVQHWKDERGD